MLDLLSQPWPWFVAGPAIGLMVPLLLVFGDRWFGISSSLRHICAATFPARIEFLRYEWRKETWNLLFVVGIAIGAFAAAHLFPNPQAVAISPQTGSDIAALGITDQTGLIPPQWFSWHNLRTAHGILLMVVGGFLVGFGSRYAGGCTSGHAITGLSSLQMASLISVIAFFAGGLLVTHIVLPAVFGGGM